MTKTMRSSVAGLAALALLAGCATTPTGPSVLVLPGTGRTYDQFRIDDMDCRQFAGNSVGGANATQSQVESGVRSGALGAALGGLAGAAIGGRSGAAVGVGTGAAIGGVAGVGSASQSSGSLQQRYDNGYQQCMYAKGHRIPVAGSFSTQPPPPSAGVPPPPPPGAPPPPPPR